jgi:hypothetical protein
MRCLRGKAPDRHRADPAWRRWARIWPRRVSQHRPLTAGVSHPARRHRRFRSRLETAPVLQRLIGRFLASGRRARAVGGRAGRRRATPADAAYRMDAGFGRAAEMRLSNWSGSCSGHTPKHLARSAGSGRACCVRAAGSLCSRGRDPARQDPWSSPATGRNPAGQVTRLADRAKSAGRVARVGRACRSSAPSSPS